MDKLKTCGGGYVSRTLPKKTSKKNTKSIYRSTVQTKSGRLQRAVNVSIHVSMNFPRWIFRQKAFWFPPFFARWHWNKKQYHQQDCHFLNAERIFYFFFSGMSPSVCRCLGSLSLFDLIYQGGKTHQDFINLPTKKKWCIWCRSSFLIWFSVSMRVDLWGFSVFQTQSGMQMLGLRRQYQATREVEDI